MKERSNKRLQGTRRRLMILALRLLGKLIGKLIEFWCRAIDYLDTRWWGELVTWPLAVIAMTLIIMPFMDRW